jgi:hypothetical protein
MRLPLGIVLAGWIVTGCLLALLAGLAWLQAGTVQGWIAALQRTYGAGPDPAWPLRADAHVHMLVSFIATLWFGVASRLFAPRTLPWLPVALAILLALSDELAQIGSVARSFEWGDQAGDVVGITLAFPLLLLLTRVEVVRSVAQRAATSSRATRRRS